MTKVSRPDLIVLLGVSVDISMILEAAGKHKEIPKFMEMCQKIQNSDRTKGIQIRTMVQYLGKVIEDLK